MSGAGQWVEHYIQKALLTLYLGKGGIMRDLQIIQHKIYEIRGQRVMLDHDLATMYGEWRRSG